MSEKEEIYSEFLKDIYSKIEEYENHINSGIFLNVNKDRDISEIIGVIDYFKEKFKRWNNHKIFSYSGELFKNETILVVGATDEEEAKKIIFTVFLNVMIKENKIKELSDYKSVTQLEKYIIGEITDKLKKGYPDDKFFEEELYNHLKNIIDS